MGRERNFTETEVIDHAADLFSAHGFSGTSVAMLTEATGLGKQSLYNAFGDKQALYLKAVDCAAGRCAQIVSEMRNAPDGRTAIHMFYAGLVDLCASHEPSKQSCIVSNGLTEDIDNAEIRSSLQNKWLSTHEMLRSTIERGQRDGSIKSVAPSAQVADFLMSMMSGVRITSKVDATRERINSTVHLALTVLDHK